MRKKCSSAVTKKEEIRTRKKTSEKRLKTLAHFGCHLSDLYWRKKRQPASTGSNNI